MSAAKPVNGIPKWYVDFQGGDRNTAIQETYLELPHVDHITRASPYIVGQRIVVNVGTYKGTEGETVLKVGCTRLTSGLQAHAKTAAAAWRASAWRASALALQLLRSQTPACQCTCSSSSAPPPALQCGELWTCKLDGVDRQQSFPSIQLHALQGAAEMENPKTLDHFEPTRLEDSLQLEEIDSWMYAYTHDPNKPVDLFRKRPDGNLWHTVLTTQRPIDSLTDYEVKSLRYVASGGSACVTAGLQGVEYMSAPSCWALGTGQWAMARLAMLPSWAKQSRTGGLHRARAARLLSISPLFRMHFARCTYWCCRCAQ
jgi:hypothetical protein